MSTVSSKCGAQVADDAVFSYLLKSSLALDGMDGRSREGSESGYNNTFDTGLTLDRMMEQVRPQAEDRIKSRLVLQAVADAEGMTVTDDDRQKEYESMAEAYQLEVDKVREMLEAKGLKEMDKDLLVKKAMDFITDNAKEV